MSSRNITTYRRMRPLDAQALVSALYDELDDRIVNAQDTTSSSISDCVRERIGQHKRTYPADAYHLGQLENHILGQLGDYAALLMQSVRPPSEQAASYALVGVVGGVFVSECVLMAYTLAQPMLSVPPLPENSQMVSPFTGACIGAAIGAFVGLWKTDRNNQQALAHYEQAALDVFLSKKKFK